MHTDPRDHVTHEDDAWLAFQYVSGELNDEAAARFEDRLAAEQPLRETLAVAVELSCATAMALGSAGQQPENRTATVVKVRPVSRWSWMTVGAVACLAVMVAGQWFARTLMQSGPVQQASAPAANQPQAIPASHPAEQLLSGQALAAEWSRVREITRDNDDPAPWPPVEEETEPTLAGSDGSAEVAPWMLAAVSAIRTDVPSDDGRLIEESENQ